MAFTSILCVVGAAIATILFSPAVRAEVTEPDAEKAVSDALAPVQQDAGPGAALVVLNAHGEAVHSRAFGQASLAHGTSFTAQTPTQIGSVAKQFTAYAILLLADRGALDLDDPVERHLPELPDVAAPLTIRHLLHHMSGLQDQWGPWWMTGIAPGAYTTQDDMLGVIFAQDTLDFEPGTEYQYINSNYTLLAEIIARISGKSYPDFLKAEIFEPLGMTGSRAIDDLSEVVPGYADSYAAAEDGTVGVQMFSYETLGPHNIVSTADDLAKWVQHLMTDGSGIADKMATPARLPGGQDSFYGMGLVRLDLNGKAHIHHFGVDAGYRAYVGYIPGEGGLVAVANSAGFPTPSIAFGVMEALFAPPSSSATAEPVVTDTTLVQRIAGDYVLTDGAALRFNLHPYESPAAYIGGPSVRIAEVDGELAIISEPSAPQLFRRRDNGDLFIPTRVGDIVIAAAQVDRGLEPGDTLTVKQTGTTTLRRVAPAPAPASLDRLVGTFRSSALGATYRVTEEDGTLRLHPPRMESVALTPGIEADTFRGSWIFDHVRFEGDDETASRMIISYGRARRVVFDRTGR